MTELQRERLLILFVKKQMKAPCSVDLSPAFYADFSWFLEAAVAGIRLLTVALALINCFLAPFFPSHRNC